MVSDVQIHNGITAMLQSVDVPAAPLEQIRKRMHAPSGVHHDRRPFAIASAAVAVLIVALPIASPGVIQTLEAKIDAILHWSPPTVRPSTLVWNGMRPETVSLNEAQERVRFTLDVPVGVPPDASGPTIVVSPTGVYSHRTHTWSIGPTIVTFTYKRGNGRSFGLSAAAASNQTGPPSKYMFEDQGADKNGNPILVKHDRFVWRNGDQITTAIAGNGISTTEIAAIRAAMHGTLIPGVWPPRHGPDVTMIRAMPPR